MGFFLEGNHPQKDIQLPGVIPQLFKAIEEFADAVEERISLVEKENKEILDVISKVKTDKPDDHIAILNALGDTFKTPNNKELHTFAPRRRPNGWNGDIFGQPGQLLEFVLLTYNQTRIQNEKSIEELRNKLKTCQDKTKENQTSNDTMIEKLTRAIEKAKNDDYFKESHTCSSQIQSVASMESDLQKTIGKVKTLINGIKTANTTTTPGTNFHPQSFDVTTTPSKSWPVYF